MKLKIWYIKKIHKLTNERKKVWFKKGVADKLKNAKYFVLNICVMCTRQPSVADMNTSLPTRTIRTAWWQDWLIDTNASKYLHSSFSLMMHRINVITCYRFHNVESGEYIGEGIESNIIRTRYFFRGALNLFYLPQTIVHWNFTISRATVRQHLQRNKRDIYPIQDQITMHIYIFSQNHMHWGDSDIHFIWSMILMWRKSR